MYRILFIFILVIAFMLLYNIFCIIFNVESKRVKQVYDNSRVQKKKFKNPKYIFAKYIKIPNFKREQMLADLFSLNWNITPEEFVSVNVFNSLMFIPFILLSLSIMNNAFFALLLLILSILFFIDGQGKINKMLSVRRRNIEEEAPTIIRYFIVSLKSSSDIKQIFKNYSEIALYLKRDVDLAVIDMDSTRNREDNIVRSLEFLDDRLNTPIMNDFITGLINVTMGKNQESYFALLERELKELSMYNLKIKTNKIEKLIRKYFYILVVFFIIMAVTEFIVFIKASIIF